MEFVECDSSRLSDCEYDKYFFNVAQGAARRVSSRSAGPYQGIATVPNDTVLAVFIIITLYTYLY